MEKTTSISRFKIRWLNLHTLILMLLCIFLSNLQIQAQTYSYTGAVQTVTLPAGAYEIEAWGADGGGTTGQTIVKFGGKGGYAKGMLTLTATTTLNIYVGGKGSSHGLNVPGGFNGGGNSGNGTLAVCGSGGGASDVRIGGTALTNRIIVAGGGGAAGYQECNGLDNVISGGHGGGLIGGDPIPGSYAARTGKGGTQTAGGAAGTDPSNPIGSAGTLGLGGNGATTASNANGGGGGGGYYGGGAGTNGSNCAGGGGGGSSYIGGVSTGVTYMYGTSGFVPNPDTTGNGTIVITSMAPCSGTPSAGTISSTVSNICLNNSFTLSATGATKMGGITYQWQSAPAATGPWTDISTATGASYTVNNQTATTYYRFIVTCANGNSTATSNVVNVVQNLPSQCYCIPTAGSSSTTYYLKDLVSTGGLTNFTYAATSYSAYQDKTNIVSFAQAGGSSVNIAMTPSLSTNYFYCWIDWNQDGDFNDPGETIWATTSYTANYNGTINVPVGQAPGNYRVRFANSGISAITACGPAPYGSYVDVALVVPPACSGTPTAGTAVATTRTCSSQPFTLSLTGGSVASGITFQWQSSPVGANTFTNISGATSSTLTVTNQTLATDYRCVVTCTSGGATSNSTVVTATQPAAISTSFFEGFETTASGSSSNNTVPTCWTYLNTTNSSSAYGYASGTARTGVRSFYTYRFSSASTGDLLLISPETVNLGNGTKQVRFWARTSATSYATSINIYSMNGTTSTATKTLIQQIPLTSTTYQEFIVPLPATTDDYFAFATESSTPNMTSGFYLDDINYEDLSPCIFPMNLQVANITQNTATISWNASLASGVTSYEYEIRTSGAAGSGATGLVQTGTVNAPATTVNVSNLPHSTGYIVYIRSKCGANNGIWTTFPVKFNTLCGIITGNFFEGFETTSTGGSSNQNAPVCWTNLNTTSSTSVYGYVSGTPKTGLNSFYAYRTLLANAPGDLMLISPETDNLGNGNKRVRFWARSSSTSYTPKLSVYRMDGNTASATKTLIKSISLTSTTYTEYIVYLPVTTDDYFAFGFEHNSASEYPAVYLDDIYYEDSPSCRPIDDATIKVSNIGKNSFAISWQDLYNLNPMAYEVEVRATGNPGTPGAAFIGTTAIGITTITATGLNPSTEYKVYVRSVCSATDQSIWTAMPGSVKTLCNYSDFVSYTQSLAVCGAQKAVLDAVLVDPTFEAAWYDNATDVEPLFVGSNFVSEDDVTQNRSFWLRSQKVIPNSSIQVGNGTSTTANSSSFNYSNYEGYKHHYIYTAEELNALGLVAGPITALKFDIATAGSNNPLADFSVALGQAASPVATFPMVDNSTLTNVYSNSSESVPVGIKTITFTTPYNWDGASDIVVQIVSYNGAWGSPYGALRTHTTPVNRTAILYSDNASAALLLTTNDYVSSPYIGNTTSNIRPNTVFVGNAGCISPAIEIPVTFEPKPAFELSSATATSCEGGVTTTPVTITTNLGGYDTFVWTPSTGVSGDAVNGWTFSTAQEQEYVLSASQSNGICEHLKTVRVFAGKKPEANAALASTYDLCKDQVQELKALEALPATVTIGAGLTTTASTSEVSAFVQSNVYSKQQFIYSAAELLAQGLTTSGYITSLSFETINSGASFTNPKYTIKMMLTPNTSFGTTNFETGNLSTVFSKVNHTHTFQGTQTMVFDSPFYWDGQSNVLVEITQEGAGSGNNAETYYTAVTGTNVGMYATSATDADPTSGTRTTERLNAKFGLTQSAVTWSPATNLYLDAAATVPYTSGTNALKVYVTSSVGLNQVYNAALTAPLSGCTLDKAITINVTDVVTPVVQSQTFCQASPVTAVVVTGAPTATFNFYNSATATTPISTISQTGTYYVEAVQGLCKSVRVPFTATITPLGLPTAQFTQVVCGGGTVSALMATGVNGSQIRWYDSATSTTPLSGTQALVNNTTYYASQVLGTCESARISVLVNINPAPAALTPQTISICGSLSYGAVNLNQIAGSELVWYPSATSQTPIPNTGQILSGTYYVSQKVNGCESLRVQIIASSQGSVAAPTASIQNICGSGTVAQLVAQILPGATAEWYNNATATTPLAATTALVNGTYYVSQRVGNCVSVKVPVAVRVISTSAPAVSPISMCAGSTIGDLSLPSPTGTSYNWYLNSTSTTPLPLTDVLQSGYYFVTRIENGCESLRTQVQITINSRPSSPVGATPQTFTDYAEISNLVMTQPNVVWYITYDDAIKGINPLAQNMPLVNGTTYYAVIIGANGCPSLPTPIEAIIVLGVNDFDLSKLKYYPNPVNDLLTITYTDVIKNVEVFDLNGRLVISRNFDNQTVQLDFGNLSSGTYMLNIKTKENSQFVKIVKK